MSPKESSVAPVEQPFIDGCHQGVLRLQRCTRCHRHQFYPRLVCGYCWARDLEWVSASGKGRIASFTVVRLAVSPAHEAPYVVALVDLKEGPRMMSRVTDCDPESVQIGAQVKVAFAETSDGAPLPVFEPDND